MSQCIQKMDNGINMENNEENIDTSNAAKYSREKPATTNNLPPIQLPNIDLSPSVPSVPSVPPPNSSSLHSSTTNSSTYNTWTSTTSTPNISTTRVHVPHSQCQSMCSCDDHRNGYQYQPQIAYQPVVQQSVVMQPGPHHQQCYQRPQQQPYQQPRQQPYQQPYQQQYVMQPVHVQQPQYIMQPVHYNSTTQQQPIPTSYAPVHNAPASAQQYRQRPY